MERLRTPLLLLALAVILAAVLIEWGAVRAPEVARYLPGFVTGARSTSLDKALQIFTPEQRARLLALQREKSGEMSGLTADLTGFAGRSLLFVDGFLLFTIALMAVALVVPEPIQARLQGIVTLIFAIVVIIAALAFIVVVLAKLIFMLALLLAFPFGTLIYLIIFGSFPRGAALALISLLFILRVLFAGLLVLAHQRFLQNTGLLLYTLAAFIAGIVVSFLYGLAPGILVSITDALAAIIVAVIGIILAIILLVGAIISIVSALQP